jgi:hypothetical protein
MTVTGCMKPDSPENTTPAETGVLITQPAAQESIRMLEFTTTLVAQELHTPSGLAIQTGSGDVFVSTTRGVIRLDAGNNYSPHFEITGFGEDTYGKGPSYQFGPLGLGFLDDTTLVVGGGGGLDGEDQLYFFDVGLTSLPEPISAETARHKVGPIRQGEQSHRGEGNYFALHINEGIIYTGSHGDDSKGWVSRVSIDDHKPGALEPFFATKVATAVDGPSGLALLRNGKLLVSQTGELHERPDSVLALFDAVSGEFEQKFETGLYDITAILIHPTTGTLYVLDFAWAVPGEGGLFSLEIDYDRGRINVVKHASLLHPTAMAVTTDGNLIVTCVEDQDEKTEARGKAYRVSVR